MRGTLDRRHIVAGLLLLATAGLLAACSESRAEPVEVTYYYLPG